MGSSRLCWIGWAYSRTRDARKDPRRARGLAGTTLAGGVRHVAPTVFTPPG